MISSRIEAHAQFLYLLCGFTTDFTTTAVVSVSGYKDVSDKIPPGR